MKKSALISVFVLMFIINGCGINDRAVDPGLENDASVGIQAHKNQRGLGYGLWNQQRERNNPIANIVTRDERPGRGMNGIIDRKPNEMTQRNISRMQTTEQKSANSPNPSGYTTIDSIEESNILTLLSMKILKIDSVHNASIMNKENQMLIAIDSTTNDYMQLKQNIISYVKKYYPYKEIIVINDRETVDRVRKLNDELAYGRLSIDFGIKVRELFIEANQKTDIE